MPKLHFGFFLLQVLFALNGIDKNKITFTSIKTDENEIVDFC